MTEENKEGFAAKARRRAVQAGAAVAIGLNAGCQFDEPRPALLAQQANEFPAFSVDTLTPEVLTGLQDLARQVADGKKLNKLIAERTLQLALQDYENAHPGVRDQMKGNGFLHIHEADSGKAETAAVFIDFSSKALVAAKGIKMPMDKDLPIYDLTHASRAGAVIEKDKALKPQEEAGYMQMAYRFRDKNMNIATTTIQRTILQTGDIRKLSKTQFALLDDDDAVRARFNASEKLFPLVAMGRDVVLKRFDTANHRMGVNIRWKEDERVYEAKRFNPSTEYWEAAGKANPYAASVANKDTGQQQR